MNTTGDEIRLDREPDEERKSEFPLGDNTVKPTPNINPTDTAGYPANANLDQTSSADLEGSPENDASTKGS